MCGICGFFQSSKIADLEILKVMNDQIVHRGPDDDGYYFNGKVGLAARRLSIIDLVTGHQPLATYSGRVWITYNGEVYNFKELKKDLVEKGYKFNTETDTEVIATLYEEYGYDFVKKLRGMFAVGIYDLKRDILILARDHIGIKPLHYHFNRKTKTLLFGSEIKSMLKYPGFEKELNPEALDYFMTLEYIPAPLSMYKGIEKLKPGHMMVFDGEKTEISRYWKPRKIDMPDSFEEQKELYHQILDESVKIRMISDVPLGSFLSGGVDSSTIVSVMARESEIPVKTFSIGFEEKSYSELKYSKMVSEKFGTDHYVKTLKPDINELVHYISGIMDEPLGDFSNFPTYLVSKAAKEKVTVALSGDGGDEIFGGYEHYLAQKMAGVMDRGPMRALQKPFAGLTGALPPMNRKKGFINRLNRFGEGFRHSADDRHFRWMIFLSAAQKRELYSGSFNNEMYYKPLNSRSPFDEVFVESSEYEGLNKDMYLDLKTYMVDNILVKVDRMSMAASLEARVPLLDYNMVEFAFSLSPDQKIKGKETKYFMKKCMEGILPNEVIYRPKEGFSIPIKNWLKSDLKELMLETLSEKNVKADGYFNSAYVNTLMEEHLNNRANHSHRLWTLMLFHMWKKNYLDG